MKFQSLKMVAAAAAAALALAACGSTQYIMSTKEGQMIVSSGKPTLDERTGMYTYYDAEGKKGLIAKDAVVQILER